MKVSSILKIPTRQQWNFEFLTPLSSFHGTFIAPDFTFNLFISCELFICSNGRRLCFVCLLLSGTTCCRGTCLVAMIGIYFRKKKACKKQTIHECRQR